MKHKWWAAHLENGKIPETKEEFRISFESWIEHVKAFVLKGQGHYSYDMTHYNPYLTLKKDQLLIYEAKQGWKPLCEFLGVPIPNEPYPHFNKKETFQEKYSEEMKKQKS